MSLASDDDHMAPEPHSTHGDRRAVPDRWTRWADTTTAHDADDQLRSRVIVILVVMTLVCFGTVTVLIA